MDTPPIKLLAAADMHGQKEKIDTLFNLAVQHQPDLLVLAGDLISPFGSPSTLDPLNALKLQVMAIHGNSDRDAKRRLFSKYPWITELSQVPVRHQHLNIIGFSGTIPLPFLSKIRLRENHLLKKTELHHLNHTVVVAHPPPRGTLDQVGGKFHAGSIALRNWVRRTQPDLLICGHIHEASGIERIGRTQVVNCAMNKSCSAAIIEYDKEGKTTINLMS